MHNKRSTDIKSNLFDFISVFLLLYSAFSTTRITQRDILVYCLFFLSLMRLARQKISLSGFFCVLLIHFITYMFSTTRISQKDVLVYCLFTFYFSLLYPFVRVLDFCKFSIVLLSARVTVTSFSLYSLPEA